MFEVGSRWFGRHTRILGYRRGYNVEGATVAPRPGRGEVRPETHITIAELARRSGAALPDCLPDLASVCWMCCLVCRLTCCLVHCLTPGTTLPDRLPDPHRHFSMGVSDAVIRRYSCTATAVSSTQRDTRTR